MENDRAVDDGTVCDSEAHAGLVDVVNAVAGNGGVNSRVGFLEAAGGEIKAEASVGQGDKGGIEGETHAGRQALETNDGGCRPGAAFIRGEVDGNLVEIRSIIFGKVLMSGDQAAVFKPCDGGHASALKSGSASHLTFRSGAVNDNVSVPRAIDGALGRGSQGRKGRREEGFLEDGVGILILTECDGGTGERQHEESREDVHGGWSASQA